MPLEKAKEKKFASVTLFLFSQLNNLVQREAWNRVLSKQLHFTQYSRALLTGTIDTAHVLGFLFSIARGNGYGKQ